ncbi:dihydrodipicolinate synthase family protein [Streptomyces odontomachi]|uniref:dihydrodipicolinate synthase family protein n=1 Tax=Streptomyces odontomachi TaxID=2944940 RepID=UPI00210D2E09|nr:dihydrodipicolinate synthase family protein [Streptomyces sp. ODS25]
MITSTTIELPAPDGGTRRVELAEPARLTTASAPPSSRIVYSAAHVVADPLRSSAGSPTLIDWEATLRIRHRLWDLGLGVAESMDTAQRGTGLSCASALELGKRTLAESRSRGGGAVLVGISTDQLNTGPHTLGEITDAYLEQLSDIQDAGGSVVLMASRHLARAAGPPEDYLRVYDAVLSAATRPVVLHWLGDMFDPALTGYWGSRSPADASETVLSLISTHRSRIAGIKLSLLDEALERAFRRRLPQGVRMFTGDDYHYVDLIAGDEHGHSDALLGAFAAVPRFASASFLRLDEGDVDGYRALLGPTQALSRLVFEAPTRYYKVGVAWVSYLTGWQDHFRMVAGFETGRSLLHLAEVFEAANRIGLFPDPDFSAARAAAYFRGHGL